MSSILHSRTIGVVRMQLVNRQTYLWVPMIVLAGAFAITLATYGIIAGAGVTGPMYGGGAQAPLWYFGVVGAQAMALTFPFSQAMSVTRREFFTGTILTAALTAAILSVLFVIGGFVEDTTGGWGMNGYFFRIPWVWDAGAGGAFVFFFALAMTFFVSGFWGATIYKRWGAAALTSVLVGLALVLVGALWLVGRMNAWAELGAWFAAQGIVGMSLWMLVVIAALGAMSYATLRRATP